ncbi:MAG: Peptidase [Halanaerobiales bacterium]|nr:Peptidase [Halanaerobiales bacterium]
MSKTWLNNNTILLNGKPYEVKYFTKNEKNDLGKVCWGEPDKINPLLIYLLDQMRGFVGSPFRINYGTQGVHSPNSQHYLGNAVDGYFPGLSIKEQFLIAIRFPFTGIGVYPYWNNPGLHLDVRQIHQEYKAMWWRDSRGDYQPMETIQL